MEEGNSNSSRPSIDPKSLSALHPNNIGNGPSIVFFIPITGPTTIAPAGTDVQEFLAEQDESGPTQRHRYHLHLLTKHFVENQWNR